MTKKEPTEAEVIALFDGYWSHLSSEVLDGYRSEFEQRGWGDALEVVEDEMSARWVATHPHCVTAFARVRAARRGSE